MTPEKIASHEPTAVKRDPNQGTCGEPVSSQDTINTDFQGKLEQALVNPMSQHRVYLRPLVVKNAGKHLVHVRN
jgi:hypothetical protein